MPRLSVCPQHHVWTSAGDGSDVVLLVSPVCGLDGRPAAVVLTNGDDAVETISPALVPPVVDDVTLVHARPRVSATADDGSAPSVPGYEILRELGRGGMGVVYLARDQRLKRLVALKMILAGAHADLETRNRFRREAEAIARLQHPGIVQIHEVAEHQGRPYLALEYVEGSNLAYQLARGAIPPRTGAALAESLARIVHHAHERGIVHRDLTPRNVLLAPSTSPSAICFDFSAENHRRRTANISQSPSASPALPECFEPKITDFGLAKELDIDSGQTQTGMIVGTPSYMAPEQALGRSRDVTPATDVHALGAILYEALAGRPPFLGESGAETLRHVVERDPVPPSRLHAPVPPDLETICLKCLAKEPHRRYSTALELAEDLRRYLACEPIHARPVSRRERAWKWVRRHPAATGLLAVIAVSIAALLTGGVIYNAQLRQERDRAETSLELAMRAIDQMLSEVGEVQLATEPRMEAKRQSLLTGALQLHRELMQQQNDDPRLRFATAQAYRRMADVLRLLEQHDEALAAYQGAIALLEQLRADSDDSQYREQLARCRNFQGEVHRAAGSHQQAENAYRESARLEEELAREFPEVPRHRQGLARTLYSLGIVLRQTNRSSEAEREFRRSAELLAELARRSPGNPEYQQHLARAYLNLGTAIRAPERFDEAKAAYDDAIALLDSLTKSFPEQPDYRHELAVALNNTGNLLSQKGARQDARAVHDKAGTLLAALAVDFPRVPVYRQNLANTWNSIGRLHFDEAEFDPAAGAWHESARLLEELVAQRADVPTYRGDLGMVLGNLGLACYAQERLGEARTYLEQAVERLKSALDRSGAQVVYRESLRDVYQNLAEVLVTSGDHAAAAHAARNLATAARQSPLHRYFAACFLARCVPLAENDQELDAETRRSLASAYADQSIAEIRSALQAGFDDHKRIEADRQSILEPVASRPDFRKLVANLAMTASAESH
jgi:serine/threonine protein kinase